jgi:von Willebrand factor type A domain/Vault protein inter-alpha-trypsin domain
MMYGDGSRSALRAARLVAMVAVISLFAGLSGCGSARKQGEATPADHGRIVLVVDESNADLSNDEIGLQSIPTNFNVDRIDEYRGHSIANYGGARSGALRVHSIPYGKLATATNPSSGGGNLQSKQAQPPVEKPNLSPQVWHCDQSQPTLARVYVGDKNALDLVSMHVTVTIEGPRARTLVDHVFCNPHDKQLEGTFEYPLPTGASPSYFGMFLGQTRDAIPAQFFGRGGNQPAEDALARMTPTELVKNVDTNDWGRLQEARIVSKEKALETYEEIVRGKVDPALLEYAGGNTFRGRVFPIAPKGYNRVLIAYEELLPITSDRMVYRFPLPGKQLSELKFSLQARSLECKELRFHPDGAKQDKGGGQVRFSRTWKEEKPQGEVLFSCTPADPRIQAISGQLGDNGPLYTYVRLRPEVPAIDKGPTFSDHAVFLLDTSLSEHPDRFDVNMRLLKRILEQDPDIKHFNVLTFNVGSAWVEPKGWLANTAEGREKVFARLNGLLLEGATDVSCALDKLVQPGFEVAAGTPLNCFLLSDGQITWGSEDVSSLVARFERKCPFLTRFHCYRTGLGAENLELFETLTRKGGGLFNCFGEADLVKAASAHRNHCLQIDSIRFVDGPAAGDVLVAGRRAAVYPGGDLVVAARMKEPGRCKIQVEGKFQGKPVSQEFQVEVGRSGELAPRAWAEIAVTSLLAFNDPRFDTLAVAYCQQYGIVSRAASYLVLENDADYKRLNLEEERGKTVTGDMGDFLNDLWKTLSQEMSPRKALERLLAQVESKLHLQAGNDAEQIRKLLALLTDKDFELPVGELAGTLLTRADVPPSYLEERQKERRELTPYLTEARRRADSGDVSGAVRALSSIMEEHPGRSDAQRLVGYRLLDLRQPAQAARLFQQVQQQRPFEPHSYRDLARSLEESGRYGLAGLYYEIVLAGQWHARFGNDLKLVAQEEYARMMQDAVRKGGLGKDLLNHFGERLERMTTPQLKADLRVTITWNTDATDVDLWVIEPDGTKCFYSNPRTPKGGQLSQDQTQGYGPERYQIPQASKGEYKVMVHYFGINRNLLGGETYVQVMVTRNAGSPQEVTERHTVILKKHNDEVEVCRVKF